MGLTGAVGALSAADMEIYAQVARLALARLVGDTAARDAAEAWIRAQRVANPAGVARMICPMS